jgi:tRNA uridine 5-carbamoylmethylation protein Kti12
MILCNIYDKIILNFENHLSKIFEERLVFFSDSFDFVYRTFSEGGNFSREEVEVYRKKLEKTAYQIEQAETTILKEMEKLEKKQLEEANKIMNEFRERLNKEIKELIDN